jgi:hypothetical protein
MLALAIAVHAARRLPSEPVLKARPPAVVGRRRLCRAP